MAQRAKVPLSHLTSIHRWKDRTDLTNRYINKELKLNTKAIITIVFTPLKTIKSQRETQSGHVLSTALDSVTLMI